MTAAAGLVVFVGFVAAALSLAWCWSRLDAAGRRVGATLFIAYVLAASFGAGLTNRDLFPFAAWQLVAGELPPVWSAVRLVGVDSLGVEHDIDARAWEPLSYDELQAFLVSDFGALDPAARSQVLAELLRRAEASRARAAAGGAVGTRGRVLGPLAAPFFLRHRRLWSGSEGVPGRPFVQLRYYRMTWRLDARERDPGAVGRRLVAAFPDGRP